MQQQKGIVINKCHEKRLTKAKVISSPCGLIHLKMALKRRLEMLEEAIVTILFKFNETAKPSVKKVQRDPSRTNIRQLIHIAEKQN